MFTAADRLKILDQATVLMECERELLKLGAPSEIIRHVNIAKKMLEEKYESRKEEGGKSVWIRKI